MSPNAGAVSPSVMSLDPLSRFAVATPALADARALLQRVDRKFLLPAASVAPLLDRLDVDYFLLRAGQHAWARYDSVYFDTPGRDLYHAHRRGRRPRYKVRIRHHVDRQLAFLEVKRKDRGGRTSKQRLAIPYPQLELGDDERHFIETHAPLDAAVLVPTVSISFRRLTLLGDTLVERLTLDCELEFTGAGLTERVPRLVIAEVKQQRGVNHTGATTSLRAVRAREAALSKYCLGTILLTSVPANVFKPALRAVERFSG